MFKAEQERTEAWEWRQVDLLMGGEDSLKGERARAASGSHPPLKKLCFLRCLLFASALLRSPVLESWLILLTVASVARGQEVEQLERAFLQLPEFSRPWVNWFWMDGNITREGITADLEAMARVGIGGVLLMDVSQDIPPGPVRFGSPQWREMFQHTLAEAQRLGLEVSINNDPGWSGSGGPWITPELAMQRLVWSKTNLLGPMHFDAPLRPLPLVGNFGLPIATLAFPAGPAGAPLLPGFATKIGLSRKIQSSGQVSMMASNSFLHREVILDLTSKTDEHGRLTWDVPAGQWTVLRLAYTLTGMMNHPTGDEGSGLECDKLSRAAVEAHFAGMLGKLITDAGTSERRRAFAQTHIDSWEVAFQNWTPLFPQEFRQRRGYDLLPYLPTFAGRIVETPDLSDRFLWDVRRTIADLVAKNYAQHLAELAHTNGLKLSIEAYGNGPFDDLMYAGSADVPMGEFWTEKESGSRFGACKAMASAAHTYGKPVIAAEAFTSFPETAKWQNHPFSLKRMADAAFCAGVNRLVIHRYAHQPWLDRKPGMTMGQYGVHYERTQTWWEQSKPWHEYLARCQFLLQQGLFAADICYLLDEGAYSETPTVEHLFPPPPTGYQFDIATPEVALTRMSARDGRIVLPDGMNYRVLVLPNTELMTPMFLRKIKSLAEDGAAIVGPRPSRSPSLTAYPQCDAEVKELAQELWGPCDGKTIKEHIVGKGKMIWGKPLRQVLDELHALADFEQLTGIAGYPLNFIHRELRGASIYFVANSNSQPVYAECAFRDHGKQPQLWHADNGKIERPGRWREKDGRTILPLRLDCGGSLFVVFSRAANKIDPILQVIRDGKEDNAAETQVLENGKLQLLARMPGSYELKTASGRILRTEIKTLSEPIELSGKWEVRFPTNAGAPERVTFDKLLSWSEHSISGVKYFSGTATYRKNINVRSELLEPNRRLYLDLGRVDVIAELTLNGRKVGTLWKPPFEAEITDFVRPGENALEVAVVNLWPNRLIGDEHLPDDCQWRGPPTEAGMPLLEWPKWLLEGKPSPTGRLCFATWKHWKKDSPLLESGLLGPVRLRVALTSTLE